MTDYIKFAPQIAQYFHVTPEYVLQVYQHVQLTEATVWMQMTLAWAFITFALAIIVGLICMIGQLGHRGQSFVAGFVCTAIVVGIITGIVCVSYGNWAIQIAQPEYMTWVRYCYQLQLAPA